MDAPTNTHDSLTVACLCARWCRTCDDYQATFDALAPQFAAQARFLWIDIEDEAALLGDLDVEDFPTLLIARGDQVCFFGPVTPHPQTAQRLLQSALAGELAASTNAQVNEFAARLRAR